MPEEAKRSRVIEVDIEKEVKKSYMEYAMSVIISRALPDVRDGLKPVHRRILYTMYETGLTPDRAYRKSVTAVGDVLGKYHPHGETSVYDALVRMAQDFSLRYMLVDGQGNFGSVDGDPPAAYRYTEAKMTKLSVEMLRDIEKDTVDYRPNFDGRLKEPVVLPARFPQLLVNGSVGISVGMATNIPPHNMNEVIDGALLLLDNPDADMEDLMEIIKGPDFPTGGIILGRAGIRAAYATGKGHIKVRGRAEIEEMDGGKSRIVITEIPYAVNKAKLCESIADLVKDKRVEGITAIRDESSRKGMRVVVEMSRGTNANVVLNRLYRYTRLQDTFAVNMLALVDNAPKVLSLKEVLTHYLSHQKEIIVRRTEFDLKKALDRAHILLGLRIAVDHIDEVIRIIRASENIPAAKEALMKRFSAEDVHSLLSRSGMELYDGAMEQEGLSDAQATAIVSMTLGQLTGLGVDKIEREYDEKMAIVRRCREILASAEIVRGIIRDEMTDIKRRFGDERRTAIEAVDDEIDIEDLIKEESCVYTLTKLGYIKRIPADAYRAQRRGGRGVSGITIREEDIADTLFVGMTHDYIMFFTSEGRVYRLKGYQIPEAGRTARGMNIVNLLELLPDERVTAMLHVVPGEEEKGFLIMTTRAGTIKRLRLSALRSIRRNGLRAIMLAEGDGLISVKLTGGNDDILIATKKGRAASFRESAVRPMGRNAAGVRGIRLAEGDEVIGASVLKEGSYVLTITENGYGKLTREHLFPRHNRGTKGVVLHNLTEKTGDISNLLITDSGCDILLITSEGTIIRTQITSIRVCGRASQGVIVMRTADGEKVIGLAQLSPEEDEECDACALEPGEGEACDDGDEPDDGETDDGDEDLGDDGETDEIDETEETDDEFDDEPDDEE